MAIGVRITSNNLNGKTATVTFAPVTGGTEDLGTKTIPFNNINEKPYGTYSLYFAEYDYTYELVVQEDTIGRQSYAVLTTPISNTSNFGLFNIAKAKLFVPPVICPKIAKDSFVELSITANSYV